MENIWRIAIGLLFCFTILTVTVDTRSCSAQTDYFMRIIISEDGSIEPANAPIQKDGETYTLTGDVGGIQVRRSNIVLDGAGYMMPGMVSETDSLGNNFTVLNDGGVFAGNLFDENEKSVLMQNVTVKNFVIRECKVGIWFDRVVGGVITNNTITGTHAFPFQATAGIFLWKGSNITIAGNQLTDNYQGIYIAYESNQNMVIQNNITSSDLGIGIEDANYNGTEKNRLYYNNIYNNTVDVNTDTDGINVWDNGKIGNYWGSYNGSDSNGDGVGDTPYVIDANQQDNYPLMALYGSKPPTTGFELTPTTIAIAIAIAFALIASATIIINQHKKTIRQPSH